MIAPILLFVYNRLIHTQKTIKALQENELANQSTLYIFSDAPHSEKERIAVESVRNYIKGINGFKQVIIKKANKNNGLAKSIILGVSEVIKIHKRVIVLEDDLITSKNYLTYMNSALNFYSNNPEIFQISGYSPPISLTTDVEINTNSSVYFAPRICSWGWGVWEDRWESIDWELSDFKEFIKNRKAIKYFSHGGKDKISVLIGAYQGFNDVWAIICEYGRFKCNNSLVVYPKCSKVKNIGSDGSGIHKDTRSKFDVEIDNTNSTSFNFQKFQGQTDYKRISKHFEKFYSINQVNRILTLYSYKLGIYKKLKKLKNRLVS